MVNEERIKLMTRMAAYEKEKHQKNKKIVSFFKKDYISMQMLKSIICTTMAFGIVFALYILYDFEIFMKEIYDFTLYRKEYLLLNKNLKLYYKIYYPNLYQVFQPHFWPFPNQYLHHCIVYKTIPVYA